MSLSRTSVWSAQSPTMTTRRCHASLENALLASGPVPSLLLQKTAWMCLMLTAPKPLTMCYPSWAQIRPVPYPGMVTLTRVHSVSLGQSASPLCRNTLRSIKVLLGVIGFLDVTLMSSFFCPLQLSRVRNCSERWVTVCSVPSEEWWEGAKDPSAARDPAQSSLSDWGQQRFCQRSYTTRIPHCQGWSTKASSSFLTNEILPPKEEAAE